jgi:hypothetical protein
MKVFLKMFFFLQFFSILLFAQEEGARQKALSDASVAISDDVFAIFNNVSGLAQLNWREIGAFYSPAPFGIKELSSFSFAYLEPFEFGNAALGINTYGYELLRESKLFFGYSKNLSNKIFLGATIGLSSISIKRYGSDNALFLNFGGLAYLTKEIRIGFSTLNLNRATYGKDKSQIPASFNLGVSYAPIYQAIIAVSASKQLDKDIAFNLGAEFFPIDHFCIRSGFKTYPSQYYIGTGIVYSFLQFDYAFSYHNDLGSSHYLGVIFSFSEEISRSKRIQKYLQNQ